MNISTQYEITVLGLLKNYASPNQAFNLQFPILTGTAPNFSLDFENQNIQITYNEFNKIATSNSISGLSVGLYNFRLIVSNLASYVILNGTFEIGSPIVNPSFQIINNSLTSSDNSFVYDYGNPLVFSLNMQSGSNVGIQFYSGESEGNNMLLISDQLFEGNWNPNSPLSLTHNYKNPGTFRLYANFSNNFNFIVISHTVSIVSNIKNLIPSLEYDPVIYSALGAPAYFMFSYYGITKSGSHASVTFWPGDSLNQTFGSFDLGMNFDLNKTTNQLIYDYKRTGTFNAVFLISNILGSKSYNLTFTIVHGISGLSASLPLTLSIGSTLNIKTYLIQGNDVSYTWNFDGNQITRARTGNLYGLIKFYFIFNWDNCFRN